MADESSGQEKSESPTSRRLSEARKKGDVAKSMELPSAAVLLAGITTLYLLNNYLLERFYIVFRRYLSNLHAIEITPDNMYNVALEVILYLAILLGPLMAVIVIVALVANYAQVGVLFSTEKIMPQFDRVNPLKGFANLFSKQALAQMIKSITKLLIVSWVAYREVKKAMPGILPLMDQEPLQILAFIANTSFWIFLKCAIFIALLAAMDYAFQRWQFMEKMKMTKQEVKEEAKQTEGDPMVKGRIRSIQMEMARKRMMAEVPKADVIITNPVRLAIALRYDPKAMKAPLVIAKGAGLIAQRIREIATENGIPIVENIPLAQALFKNAGLNEMIPENLFQAVAEVLAYVYSLKRKTA
ncbi:MAG: flagellar biosynthesis protein FlhB [Deltaproteobacteria bacterium RIFOXYD12_FULL_50_9]|nr:MAG: flagellar biosynthesis protein FlhB [Deltaproteobacteria bacterium RIFOXYD12_FULL_50_9]